MGLGQGQKEPKNLKAGAFSPGSVSSHRRWVVMGLALKTHTSGKPSLWATQDGGSHYSVVPRPAPCSVEKALD